MRSIVPQINNVEVGVPAFNQAYKSDFEFNNILFFHFSPLKISEKYNYQSCKLYNDKYMIASTQITNTEIFAFPEIQ